MMPFDLGHIGVFDLNFETGDQYWSAEVRRILHLRETGPIEFSSLLRNVHPDDRGALLAFRMESFRGYCPPHRSIEFRVVDTDTAAHWVHVETGAAFRPGGNDVVRTIGLVIEIDQPRSGAMPALAAVVEENSKTVPVSSAA